MANLKKCNECKHLKYTVIGKGAGYKCVKRDKERHYMYRCACDKYERK